MQGARDAKKIGAEETEVIFVRGNVSMHPTKDSSQRISGRFRIIKRSSSLFMTWIPNPQNGNTKAPLETNSNASERDRNLYSIRPVPLSEVRSIWQHIRPFASQYIIVVLVCGLAHPPLFFPNGGIKQLINKLKEHVHIVRSPDDANLYLLNDDISHDPLQKSLTFLELRDVLAVTSGAMAQNRPSLVASAENENCKENSLVSMSKERTGYDPRKLNLREAQEKTAADEMAPSRVGSFELVKSKPDSSLSIWGRARLFPLESEECATFLDNEGRVLDSKALRERIFYGGLEHRLRREVWKFLLGYHQYDSTYNEREELRIRKYKEYKVLKAQWQTISAEQAKRFAKFRERKSRVEKDVVRTDRFLPFYAGDENQNVTMLHDILVTYSFYNFDLGYCQGMSDFLSPILFVMEDESESFWCFVALMEHLAPNFNRDQNGMHSQLLALSKLVELLDSPLHKYLKQADCLNYFFCFRWILIQFKREFEYENVMRLWEVLWTHYLTEHFHLYLCVALLKRYRRKIVDEQMDFDSLLRFINGLSGHIKLEAALRDAESLCRLAGDSGASCIPAGTPPSLPVPVL